MKLSIASSPRFPAELLTHIFEDVVASDMESFCLTKSAAIWPLTQTCQSWRKVAVTAPTLWNLIRTSTVFFGNAPRPRHLPQLFKLFLERSQPLPISFIIEFGSDQDDSESFTFNQELFNLLACHSSRWRHVQMLDFDGRVIQQLCQVKDLPILHSLHLCGQVNRKHHPSPADPLEVRGLATAPALVEAVLSLSFDGYDFEDVPSPKLGLHWAQLRELTFSVQLPQDFLEIAASLTSVECLHVAIGTSENANIADNILLPRVHSLELSGDDRGIVEVASRLVLPKLQNLRLATSLDSFETVRASSRFLSSIVGLQKRCVDMGGSSIRSLQVTAHALSSATARQLKESLHDVEELYLLQFDNEGEHANDAQVIKHLKENVFPRLRKLGMVIPYSKPRNFTFLSVLADVIKARQSALNREGLAQLEQVSLSMPRGGRPKHITVKGENTELFEQLEMFGKQGLDLCGGHLEGGKWVSTPHDTDWNRIKEKRRIARMHSMVNWGIS
ncbi:hypothetical protein VNI00_008483 [Paramarasmius palmivorus]|uniref:F-box domain-containing protein n=1 Tax=Paramarasmius palmivorus TaxID=297713 RepID=A0AAW0CWZ5_9AGAR